MSPGRPVAGLATHTHTHATCQVAGAKLASSTPAADDSSGGITLVMNETQPASPKSSLLASDFS